MTKITIERETLEQAAKALAYCYTAIENMSDDEDDMISRSNSALRAALAAQPADAGRINYGSILDALDGLPNDISTEIEHLAQLVRGYGCQIGHCVHDTHLPAAQPAEPVAWPGKAMELATDFGVESLRLGSSERQDIFLSGGKASWKTVALREKREAARERLRQHIYAAPAAVPQKAVPQPVACKGIPRKGCNYLAPADTACNKCGEVHWHHQMLAHFYAATPAHAAVPLTYEQIIAIANSIDDDACDQSQTTAFARAIERAHGIAAAGEKP